MVKKSYNSKYYKYPKKKKQIDTGLGINFEAWLENVLNTLQSYNQLTFERLEANKRKHSGDFPCRSRCAVPRSQVQLLPR